MGIDGTIPRMLLVLAATLCTPSHLEGSVTAAGGDYVDIAFEVPANTAEIRIAHTDASDVVILDWGVWSPSGFRGWGGGLTEDIVIGVDQSSRGYLPGAIEPGTWTLVIGKALLAADGGRYVVDIACSDAQTLPVLPKAPFSPVVMSSERRWYKGDFHVHSSQSGDSGATLDENVQLAHTRGLDFINLSDHNTISQHALVAAQQPSWPVLVLRSSEITTYSGHGNGVGIHDYVDHRLGYRGRTAADIVDDVVAQGGMFIVNHPALELGNACIGCAWKHIDDLPWDKVSGLEVLTAGYLIAEGSYTPKVIEMWDMLEDQGHRLSAVGGSDDHTAGRNEGATGAAVGSPTPVVLASELSEAAIIDAVRHQHTQVLLRGPDDPFVDAKLRKRDGTLADIGDDIDGISRVELPVHVAGATTMFLELWRNGAKIQEVPVTSDDFSTVLHDEPGPGDVRYRVELTNAGARRIVVTSHFYVHAVAGSGGGCSTGGGSPGVLLAALAGWVARRRRRSTLSS